MEKSVTVIPASRKASSFSPAKKEGKTRVAAYARVSTDHDDQLGSVENQIEHYTAYIKQNPEYLFAGVYHDDGISGTGTKLRTGFLTMIRDCDDGKIDLIITKSISRFARNTEDCLRYSRHLKSIGVGIWFEKENINTLDSSGELLFTILSGLAENESLNISENTTWGIRSNFQKGIPHLNTVTLLGYDKADNGSIVINPEQAETVRRIYRDFMEGWSPTEIAQRLNDAGIPGVHGEPRWDRANILYILTNQIYNGSLLMQKTYTTDFLTKKEKKNNGELEQYYIRSNHEAIIDMELWDAVQLELQQRENFRKENGIKKLSCKADSPLYSKAFCDICGGKMTLWQGDTIRHAFWKCRNAEAKYQKTCQSPKLSDDLLRMAIISAWNAIVTERDTYLPQWEKTMRDGNALERLRARQMIELTEEGPLDCEVPELTRMVVHKVVVSGYELKITFMDGTEKRIAM